MKKVGIVASDSSEEKAVPEASPRENEDDQLKLRALPVKEPQER